jgi:glycosyltransferase involved in cell wall biosynthesis
MAPFFSIIIPTLNEEEYLPHVLTALCNQKEKDFEILIVDSRSDDGTRKVANSFKDRIPVKFIEVTKRNVAHQRNVGAEKAAGQYIIFLDADSGIAPTFTRVAKQVITRRKGLVFIPSIIPDDRRHLDVKFVFNFVNFLIDTSQNIGKPLSSGGSMIFERQFFLKIGGFDEKMPYSEDHDLIQRAYDWGVRAKFVHQLRITFSLRRMRREGRLRLLYKYALATAYIIFKGKVDRKLYTYEMGGQLYGKKYLGKPEADILPEYINKIKVYFTNIFKEE